MTTLNLEKCLWYTFDSSFCETKSIQDSKQQLKMNPELRFKSTQKP